MKPIKNRAPELEGLSRFADTLEKQNLLLKRDETTTLQINLGLLCDLACRHCHLSAGPHRTEIMDWPTMQQVIAYAERVHFKTIDITGGAPELVPDLPELIRALAPLTQRLMLRTNLTALYQPDKSHLLELFREHRVILIASFPSTNSGQLEAQRGTGVMDSSLEMLKQLNRLGYGIEGSGLELHLVANPSGAFMPAEQEQAERKFKQDLARKWGLSFNQLYLFANAPLGRFLGWLSQSGNLHDYMEKLVGGFNPCTVDGLMCRSLVSIAWDGILYDCDFNLAADLPLNGKRTHVSELKGLPEKEQAIVVGEHCYACTAGSGFT
ncbi:MAG TPA: arsenosugar biosynthesis radical SAM (seleno)protein ArsS [Geopsychrobacteraceae bacterium]|nr:arsenosugar biosynthesis radical SAM (seleno)protein ArsS [Geopsychrobacteraceae bacterium]